jgi:hypothetical protein
VGNQERHNTRQPHKRMLLKQIAHNIDGATMS